MISGETKGKKEWSPDFVLSCFRWSVVKIIKFKKIDTRPRVKEEPFSDLISDSNQMGKIITEAYYNNQFFAKINCKNQIQCRSKQSKLSALKKTDIGRTLVDKSNHVRQHALNFRQNVYFVKWLEINLLMIPCCYIYIYNIQNLR